MLNQSVIMTLNTIDIKKMLESNSMDLLIYVHFFHCKENL